MTVNDDEPPDKKVEMNLDEWIRKDWNQQPYSPPPPMAGQSPPVSGSTPPNRSAPVRSRLLVGVSALVVVLAAIIVAAIIVGIV